MQIADACQRERHPRRVLQRRRPCVAAALVAGALVGVCATAQAARSDWVIRRQAAAIPQAPFVVRVDGDRTGRTRLLTVANRLGRTRRFPQVLVIASSGYLRLKPGADPVPPLPFGQSLVLGPAIFGTSTSFPDQPQLFFNPQVQRVDVARGPGKLRITVTAKDQGLAPGRVETNQIADLTWRLELHEPTARRTRLDVVGRFRFTERVVPDASRTAEFQSFRLVQVSSMFIDPDRHDVDALRYRSAQGPVDVAFAPPQANALLPAAPAALAPERPLLDVVHTDDSGAPNGNSPSYRIAFRSSSGPISGPLTPRAFFTASQDLNDDNLGVWVHRRPKATIPAGTRGTIAYSIVATADPLPRP